MIQYAYTVRVTRHREQKIPIGSPDKGHTREENGSPDKKCNEASKTRDMAVSMDMKREHKRDVRAETWQESGEEHQDRETIVLFSPQSPHISIW